MSFEYDANGNRTRRTDYIGRLTKYTYDKMNRLEKTEYGEDGDLQLPVTYTYDEISQLKTATNENGTVSFNYDNRNRLLNTTDVFGHTVGYNHLSSPTLNRLELILDGSVHAQYNFDDAGRLSNIVSPADSTSIGFTYDNANRPETRTFPNGVTTTYTFDNMSRLKRLKDTSQTATLFDRQYEYDNASRIGQITELGKIRNFSYDFVNRLTGMTSPTEPAETYNFDKVGNRLSSHRSANYGYEFGQFNRVNSTDTAGYVYDQNGNIRMNAEGKELWRYQWDFDNRLVSASTRKQTVRYKYDALGRRIQRFIVGGKENTKFIYDGADVIADDNSGTLTKYINGPGVDNKLRMQTGSDVRYFIADHLGSTTALTDSSGNVTSSASYDSFGNASGNLATRYKFTGREFDDFTGLHYYRARWYDSNLGRFISEDPIGFAGGDVNLYGYVGNGPLGATDPSGENPIITLGRRIIQRGKTVIYNTRKRLTMKQAQNVRKNEGEIFVDGRRKNKVAERIEDANFYEGDQLRHDPHGKKMNPHYQTKGKEGHTFYSGVFFFFLAPNTAELSEYACTTDSQFSSALLWDGASMLDPLGVTNVIDAYTGLDGGDGGLSGLRQLTIDMNPILMPVDVGTKKLGELIYGP